MKKTIGCAYINGWLIDHFGFGAAFWTMALSYIAAGALLLLIREEKAAARA